jgi:GTP pyrophosphokinase
MTKDLKSVNKEFDNFLKEIPEHFNKEKITLAYNYAKKAHIFQKRKTGEPFVSHPLAVASIVNEIGLDEISIMSALLHDVVEDTELSLADIRQHFGEEVEMIVDGLTKITSFGRKTDGVNVDALRKILLASAKDIRILVIKLCDRLHNMRTIQDLDEERRERISNETLNIYVPIAQKVGIYSLKWELEDLALKYIDPEMYQFIKKHISLKRQEREQIVRKAVDEIKAVLDLTDLDILVLGRPKNFYSIYKKIRDKAKDIEDIRDLYAIRIITKDIRTCYTALGLLHEKFQSYPNRLKDYIANPKSNGYQSIHTEVYSKSIKNPIEVQIRTEEMHKLAEFGVAAHWRYKNLKEDKRFENKIAWLREVLQWEKEHTDNQEFLKLLKFDFFEDELFAFTPKNDVILLPEESTVLDFAFSVHTDIGKHALKAKVNGVLTTIDKTLKSGDIVEVLTNKKVKPTEKWLKIVKTNKARIKIKHELNLKHSGKKDSIMDTSSFLKLKDKITRLDEFKKVRKAGCCIFEYGDQIIGVQGKGNELVVHNASCDNAKFTLHKKIQLRWREEKEKEVTLYVELNDQIGVMMDILNIFSKSNLNIISFNSKLQKNGHVRISIGLLDGPYIEDISKKLKQLSVVESVRIYRGLFS